MGNKSHSHQIPPEKRPGHQPPQSHRDPPGIVIESHTVQADWHPCKRCNGTGKIDGCLCMRCMGYCGEYR